MGFNEKCHKNDYSFPSQPSKMTIRFRLRPPAPGPAYISMLEFLVPARIQNSPFLYIHSPIPTMYLPLSLSNFLRRPPAAPGTPPRCPFRPRICFCPGSTYVRCLVPARIPHSLITYYRREYHTYVRTFFGFPSPPACGPRHPAPSDIRHTIPTINFIKLLSARRPASPPVK